MSASWLDREYVSTGELCKRLGICRSTIYRHGLHRFAIAVGSVWRFRWADVVKHYQNEKKPRLVKGVANRYRRMEEAARREEQT